MRVKNIISLFVIFVVVIIVGFTSFLPNLWNLITGRGYHIPGESNLFVVLFIFAARDIHTKMRKQSIGRSIFYFPLTRIIIGLTVCLLVIVAAKSLTGMMLNTSFIEDHYKPLIRSVILSILLLGSAYIYFGNLWFPIAIRFFWNFAQSGLFGANVSGGSLSKTLITSQIEGAASFTGGAFGPECSVQTTLFCLIGSVVLLISSHREGKIIKPYWIKISG